MEEVLAETLKSLAQNHFNVVFAGDAQTARDKVMTLIPKGTTVGVGDSVSVRQLKVLEELQSNGRLLVDPFCKEISLMSTSKEIIEEQRWEMHKIAVNCEFFITGTNAITRDGKLVNTDGGGNRVAGMIFGPKKVMIVVGSNKIVENVDEAFYRIKNVIAPRLAKIKGMKVPCATTGRCTDCNADERICNVTTVLERAPAYTDVTVVVVDEDLGLGWDQGWSPDRIERISSKCAALTWLRRRPGANNVEA
jgi:hypothetical protein